MQKTGKRQPFTSFPKSIKNSFKLDEKPFKWTLKDCMWEHIGWKISLKKLAEIVGKLQELESRTWGEIKSDNGGKAKGNGTNNHFIPMTNLPKAELKEAAKCKIPDRYDKIFSLRIMARERLIGVVDLGVFHILWHNPEHEFF